jgi:HEAT repeat protein
MARCDASSTKPLTGLLSDSSWEIREGAALALRLHGPEALEALDCLMTLLADGNARVRRAAALALQALEHEAAPAVPALIDALKDHDRGVRGRAVFALARIGKAAERAVPILVEAQRIHGRHRDWTVAWSGALTLVHLGCEVNRAIPALTEILCDIEDNYIASELFIALDRRRLDEPFAPRKETPPLHTARVIFRLLALENLLKLKSESAAARRAVERVREDRDPLIRSLAREP